MHASRTGCSFGGIEWRTGEERVENLPRRGGYPPEMAANTAYGPGAKGLLEESSNARWEGSAPD